MMTSLNQPGPKPRPIGERYWSKVQKGESCWPWRACRTKRGYGQILVGSRTDGTRHLAYAHRVAYELTVGPIPNGLCVLHTCDNPSCVNPSHLWLGTVADNNRDCNAKGRRGEEPRGEKSGMAKLTEKNVLAIRLDLRTQSVIAANYGVSRATVGYIKRRETWRHLEGAVG